MEQLLEMLRDPLWQAVGAFIAIGAIVFQVLNRRRKILTCLINDFSLVSIQAEALGRVELIFDSEKVEDVHLVTLEFYNSGSLPIRPDDYEQPIEFHMGSEARIFSAEITETKPKNLRANVNVEGNYVWFSPILLNQGDSFTTKILVSQLGTPSLYARIAGVTLKEIDTIASFIKAERILTLLTQAVWIVIGGLLLVMLGAALKALTVSNWLVDLLFYIGWAGVISGVGLANGVLIWKLFTSD
jgi:hypothetical protein